jgi:hypothetical protein
MSSALKGQPFFDCLDPTGLLQKQGRPQSHWTPSTSRTNAAADDEWHNLAKRWQPCGNLSPFGASIPSFRRNVENQNQ